MNNNVNNNTNMVENPEGNNGGNCNPLINGGESLISGIFRNLTVAKFVGHEDRAFEFINECVRRLFKKLKLSETLKHLKVENIGSSKDKNILLAASDVILDLVQNEERFKKLLKNLSEEERVFFESEENRKLFLGLRKEDIESVVHKLANAVFYSNLECMSNNAITHEFKPSNLLSNFRLLFWDDENTKGKVDRILAIAEFATTVCVVFSSCFLFVAFSLLDKYIGKKVDTTIKSKYDDARRQLMSLREVLSKSKKKGSNLVTTKTQLEKLEELERLCSELSDKLTDKILGGKLGDINKYDITRNIPTAFFCLMNPLFAFKIGISFVRRALGTIERRSYRKAFNEELINEELKKPVRVPSLDDSNSTLDNSLNSSFDDSMLDK